MTRGAFWTEIFDRPGPVEIEIGAGRGAFLLASATAAPERNFYAIEHSHARAAELDREADLRGTTNVKVLRADAACVVGSVIPDDSVSAYHIYFPDPWWKRRHHRRRLFTAAFVAAVQRTLRPGGSVRVATDVPEYFALMTRLLAAQLLRASDPGELGVRTRFAEKAQRRGAAIHVARFVKPLPADTMS